MNKSSLEKIPKDVLYSIFEKGNIKGKDLISICISSPVILQRCDDNLFRRLLQKIGIFVMNNPRDVYFAFYKNPLWWMVQNHSDKNWDWE